MQTWLQKKKWPKEQNPIDNSFNKSLMATILEVDKFDCKCKHGCKKKWPKE